jgi:hypothetical protein
MQATYNTNTTSTTTNTLLSFDLIMIVYYYHYHSTINNDSMLLSRPDIDKSMLVGWLVVVSMDIDMVLNASE